MKNGLENGNMNEEDTVFVRTALAKFEKKLADLMLEINEDNNKAQLMENESKSNDEEIADVKRSIADLLAKINGREKELAAVNQTLHEKLDKK